MGGKEGWMLGGSRTRKGEELGGVESSTDGRKDLDASSEPGAKRSGDRRKNINMLK